MTELNDQTLLIHWYRNRNAQAFRVLAMRHAPMVYATALRVLRNPHDAEEVSQESFLALAQTRRPPSGNVAAWLHRTAYRAALGLIRTRDRRNSRDQRFADAQPASTGTAWDDIRELVDEAVAALPERHREPIVRYFFEAQTHEDIARALGVSRQTVTYRIGQGIDRVRKELARKGVVAPVGAALAALVHEHSAAALPVSASAEIGRIALAAMPSTWGLVATYVSGASSNVAAAVLVVGVAAVVAVVTSGSDNTSTLEPPVPVAGVASESPATVEAEAAALPARGGEVGAIAPPADETSAAEPPVATLAGDPKMSSVSGVVLLPDGKPFARANVSVMDATFVKAVPPPTEALHAIAADQRGRFQFLNLPPAEYVVLITEPMIMSWSMGDEVARVTLRPGEHRANVKVFYGLEGNLTVSGLVLDSAGNPLRYVEIHAINQAEVLRRTVSDEKGRFLVSSLPEGPLALAVPISSTFNEVSLAVQAGDQNVQFVLKYTGTVSGRVIDAKTREPIPSFAVRHMRGHRSEFVIEYARSKRDFTDPEGKFTFEHFPSGDATVVVSAPDYEPALVAVTVPEKETISDLVLALSPTADTALAGKVVTEEGQPIAGARVYVRRPEQQPIRDRQKVAAETNASGEFTIADAPPGTRHLYAWQPGFVPDRGDASSDSTIVLKRACRLSVEVFSRGTPLAEARVSAGDWGNAATDLAGRATVEEIPPGEVNVSVIPYAGRTHIEAVYLDPGVENSLHVELAPAEASVEGTVYEDGAPVAGGTVHLFVETESAMESLNQPITPGGIFHFSAVPLGPAQLVVTTAKPQRRVFVDEVIVAAGEATVLTVDVTADARVSGSVSGVVEGQLTTVLILRGAASLEEALDTAAGPVFDMKTVCRAIVKSGAYEAPLRSPGTYSILLLTHPGKSFNEFQHHDFRIVDVPESGDFNVDVALPK